MDECPPIERLHSLLQESLGDAERMGVEAHVEGCAICQKMLEEITSATAGSTGMEWLSVKTDEAREADNTAANAFFERLKRNHASAGNGGTTGPNMKRELVQIEGYEVLEELGRGATGVVYRALHLKLNRFVALKVIVAGPNMREEVRKRFHAEAHVIARLRHANIVQVYDVGEQGGFPFLSLELVEGGTLAEWMSGRSHSAIESARIIATMAKAVQYAHRSGVIHRDLKPENVLLGVVTDRPGKRELKITDFGIARILPQHGIAEAQMTQTGEILGTPAYMAPEQARGRGKEICPATDVYSLGAMLYELLTGRPPFQGATSLDTLMQAVHQEPVPVSLLVASVPPDLNTICLKCLEKDPAKRYLTAADLAADLGRFLKHEPIHARSITWIGHSVRWAQRHRAVAAALGGILFLLILLAVVSLVANANLLAMERQQRQLAQEKSQLADENATERDKARRAEHLEAGLREQAQTEGAKLRENLYLNQMNLASHAAMVPGGIGRVEEWLTPWKSSIPDLRNWEWYYLTGLCHRDLMTFEGDESGVFKVAWSPDGKRLASGASDRQVRIWDTVKGEQIRVLQGHTQEVASVGWSHDGRKLASGSYDGLVKVWDADTGKELLTLRGSASRVLSLAWSPDGKRIASSSVDPTIRIWDCSTGLLVGTFSGRSGTVRQVAWSPDGTQLASTSADYEVQLWNASTGGEIRTLRGHTNLVNSVAWRPDGARLATASNDGTAKIWNPVTGEEVKTLRGHILGVLSVSWSPDGSRLITGSDDQTIREWDAETGGEIFALRGHTAVVTSVDWSPDGTRLASSSFDASIKIWNAAGSPEAPILSGHSDDVTSVAWSPDNTRLASSSNDRTVKIWNADARQELLTLRGHTDWVRTVEWSRDGTMLASAGNDNTIRLWDPANGEQKMAIHVDATQIHGLAWSLDGRRLASCGNDNAVRIWDAVTGRQLQQCIGHQNIVRSVVWSPDGKRLASASFDRTVRVWNPDSGAQLLSCVGHGEEVNRVAWSPNGQSLASVGNDQTARIWDANSGKEKMKLSGHTAKVNGIAWSPDGSRLVSGASDHTVKIWDTITGREVATLNCGGSPLSGVKWSPDGLTVAVSSEDQKVHIFDASSGYLAAREHQYLPMLDRMLHADSHNAANWFLRAEIDCRRESWDEAADDLQRYLALNPDRPWSVMGYWVIGPFPDDLDGNYGPERDPHPGHPLVQSTGVESSAILNWINIPFDSAGSVDFGRVYNHAEHISAYALLRVYAPAAKDAAILLGSDDQCRLWLNGKMLFENRTEGRAIPDAAAVPAKLQVGWNTLLTRVVNDIGSHALYLRLSAEPGDLERANRESATRAAAQTLKVGR